MTAQPTPPAAPRRLLYILEPGAQTPRAHLAELVTARVYGRTLLERNLRLLGKHFDAVEVILLVDEADAGALRAALDAAPGGAGAAARVETSRARCAAAEVDAVLLQRGVGLLEDFPAAACAYYGPAAALHEAAERRDAAAPLGADLAWQARDACGPERVSGLIQRLPGACGAAGACVSTSELRTHVFAEPGRPLAAQLTAYLHAKASLRSMDGPVSRLLMRRLSRRLSRPLGRLGVHPNVITVVAAAVALLAAFLFALGDRAALLCGGVVWFAGGILDEVDGELSRLQGKESEFGGWLDLTLDRIVDGLVLVGLAWPIATAPADVSLWALTALAIILVETNSYVGLLYDSWMKSAVGRTIYFRIGRDTRNLMILVFAALSLRAPAIACVALVSLVEIARRLVVCFLWSRTAPRSARAAAGAD